MCFSKKSTCEAQLWKKTTKKNYEPSFVLLCKYVSNLFSYYFWKSSFKWRPCERTYGKSRNTCSFAVLRLYGHGDMGVTMEQRQHTVTRQSFLPACHVETLPASLLKGHPHFKPMWWVCVNRPAVPFPCWSLSGCWHHFSRDKKWQTNSMGGQNGRIAMTRIFFCFFCAQWTDQNVGNLAFADKLIEWDNPNSRHQGPFNYKISVSLKAPWSNTKLNDLETSFTLWLSITLQQIPQLSIPLLSHLFVCCWLLITWAPSTNQDHRILQCISNTSVNLSS